MKLTLNSTDEDLDYTIANENGSTISFNANGKGISPMEGLLGAVAACSSVDVEIILKKMRQKLDSLTVVATGERAEDKIPKVFKKMRLKFILEGEIKRESAEKAVKMAVEKYCSVASSLKPDIEITWELVLS
jgi:putative redox protein